MNKQETGVIGRIELFINSFAQLNIPGDTVTGLDSDSNLNKGFYSLLESNACSRILELPKSSTSTHMRLAMTKDFILFFKFTIKTSL